MICPIMTASRLARGGMSLADSGTVECTDKCMLAIEIKGEASGERRGWRCGLVNCDCVEIASKEPFFEYVSVAMRKKGGR